MKAMSSPKNQIKFITLKKMNNTFVHLSNLTPNTKYYFVIKDKVGVSPRFWFKTASNNPSGRLSIVAGGDSRNNRLPRQRANTIVKKLRPDFVYFGGDMTDRGTNKQWKRWFRDWQLTIGDDGRMIPIVVARGNHESSNEQLEKLFGTNPEVYYAMTFGGDLLRAYVLNTQSSIGGNQTQWLKEDLEKHQNSVLWKFAIYHKPMRPIVRKKSEGTNQYKHWAPLFYKYRMNLVVESDSHAVKSTYPIKPDPSGEEGFVRDDKNGTVYVGEGCWGAPLRRANDGKSWTMSQGSFNQVKWIFVDQQQIEVRTVKVDNADKVATVNDKERFKMPNNIDLWNMKNGTVQIIR